MVEKDLFNRIRTRSKETKFARADDTEEVLKKRLEIYPEPVNMHSLNPIREFYFEYLRW